MINPLNKIFKAPQEEFAYFLSTLLQMFLIYSEAQKLRIFYCYLPNFFTIKYKTSLYITLNMIQHNII